MSTDQGTIRSYNMTAAEYATEAAAMPAWLATEIEVFVDDLRGSGRVLEIGSGGGRDAVELEKLGLSVRRTDVSRGFVELLRKGGFTAELLDPLTDDLTDPQCPGTPQFVFGQHDLTRSGDPRGFWTAAAIALAISALGLWQFVAGLVPARP